MPLKLTDEKPTQQGYYWYLHPTFTYASVVRVFYQSTEDRLNDHLSVRDEGSVYTLDQYEGKWAGPVPEPEGQDSVASERQVQINELLQKMMMSNMELYERILDTPGFAFYFNELISIAKS